MATKTNYSEAITELESIVSEIESGDISVDELSERVKLAAKLIRFCKERLTKTENEVSKALEELKSEDENIEDSGNNHDSDNSDDLPF